MNRPPLRLSMRGVALILASLVSAPGLYALADNPQFFDIISTTRLHAPDGTPDRRREIGVGEIIDLRTNLSPDTPVAWSIDPQVVVRGQIKDPGYAGVLRPNIGTNSAFFTAGPNVSVKPARLESRPRRCETVGFRRSQPV